MSIKLRLGKLNFGWVDFRFHWPSPRDIKFGWQKITRGFSDDETWNLHYEITKFILPRLERFATLSNGHPGNLTQKEWDLILREMLFSFREMGSDDWDMPKKYKDENGCDATESNKNYKKRVKRIHNGRKLFAEYYVALWW